MYCIVGRLNATAFAAGSIQGSCSLRIRILILYEIVDFFFNVTNSVALSHNKISAKVGSVYCPAYRGSPL